MKQIGQADADDAIDQESGGNVSGGQDSSQRVEEHEDNGQDTSINDFISQIEDDENGSYGSDIEPYIEDKSEKVKV